MVFLFSAIAVLSGLAPAQAGEELTVVASETLAPPVEPIGPPKPMVVVNGPEAPVPVAGTVSNRDLEAPGRQPFQEFVNTSNAGFQVPEGKRMVIEYVSGSFSGAQDCYVNFGLIRTTVLVDGKEKTVGHFLMPGQRSDLSINVGQLTRLYADGGTTVSVDAETDPNNCPIGFAAIVSGYLLDVPPARLPN